MQPRTKSLGLMAPLLNAPNLNPRSLASCLHASSFWGFGMRWACAPVAAITKAAMKIDLIISSPPMVRFGSYRTIARSSRPVPREKRAKQHQLRHVTRSRNGPLSAATIFLVGPGSLNHRRPFYFSFAFSPAPLVGFATPAPHSSRWLWHQRKSRSRASSEMISSDKAALTNGNCGEV